MNSDHPLSDFNKGLVWQSALLQNMRKLIHAFPFGYLLLASLSQNYLSNPYKSLLSLIISSSTFSHDRAFSSTPGLNAKNTVLADYLVDSLNFSKDRALSVSSNLLCSKSPEKPEEVVHFFKAFGFSDEHVQSIAHSIPQVLFANVEKTLKLKVIFFQKLGLSGPRLYSLISGNPFILACSLDRTLKPSIHLITNVLKSDGRNRSNEKVNDDLNLGIRRCNWILQAKCRLEATILYLESRGVVGSQLSSLLLRQTRLFSLPKERLEGLVSRAVDMNFSMCSRMLVHAIHCLSCLSIKTLNGKFEVLMMIGLSKNENDSMFRKLPNMFMLSDAKLRMRLEFFLNNLKINKLLLLRTPCFLAFSLEERVIPRYKVIEILKSRKLLRKSFSFCSAMKLTNERFVEKYIFPFKNDAEELLLAYNCQMLDASEK